MNNKPSFTKDWTLFLDRDGVINEEQPGSYIIKWEEFKFTDGALKAIEELSHCFGRIIIVTNQRGVGRGLMTASDLKTISDNLTESVQENGGKIDRIYACTSLSDLDHNRKPNVGMAMQAREDFPEIDFKKSVVVGNNLSDMEFGKRLGMYSVFLTTTHSPFPLPHDLINDQYKSLASWAEFVSCKTLAE